jgi:hypothetical protein
MGMRPPRMCKRCYATAEHGSNTCAAHKVEVRKRSDLRPLYKCKRWRVTRMLVLARDAQCTRIDNGVRCPELSTDVHHIIEAEQWTRKGGDFYDADNLAGLCHSHHSRHTALHQGFAVRG